MSGFCYVRTICEVCYYEFGSRFFPQCLSSFVEPEYKGSDWKITLSKKFDDTSPYGTNISWDSSNKDGCVLWHGYLSCSLDRLSLAQNHTTRRIVVVYYIVLR